MPQWLRSALAVIAGFFFIGLLAFATGYAVQQISPGSFGPGGATSDPAIIVLSLVYVAVYAVAGCWLAAALAGRRPMMHALILGALGLALNLATAPQAFRLYPSWYVVLSLLLTMPYAWLGGKLRERQLARRGAVAGAVPA